MLRDTVNIMTWGSGLRKTGINKHRVPSVKKNTRFSDVMSRVFDKMTLVCEILLSLGVLSIYK